MSNIQDRVGGILLGLAAGDRIGGPSRMAVQLTESLLNQQGFDIEDIGQRYLSWWQREGFDTGPTAAHVFALVERGRTFSQGAAEVHKSHHSLTAGCNPAHRATPLAMLKALDDEQLTFCAQQEALLTHQHPLAGDVSAAAVSLCRSFIRGNDCLTAIRTATQSRLPETQAALKISSSVKLNQDGFAPHVLAAAVYFIQMHDNFDSMLQATIKFAGPANYAPVLAGAIGGARWGAQAIEDSWFVERNFGKKVREVAYRLAEEWI